MNIEVYSVQMNIKQNTKLIVKEVICKQWLAQLSFIKTKPARSQLPPPTGLSSTLCENVLLHERMLKSIRTEGEAYKQAACALLT